MGGVRGQGPAQGWELLGQHGGGPGLGLKVERHRSLQDCLVPDG